MLSNQILEVGIAWEQGYKKNIGSVQNLDSGPWTGPWTGLWIVLGQLGNEVKVLGHDQDMSNGYGCTAKHMSILTSTHTHMHVQDKLKCNEQLG